MSGMGWVGCWPILNASEPPACSLGDIQAGPGLSGICLKDGQAETQAFLGDLGDRRQRSDLIAYTYPR